MSDSKGGLRYSPAQVVEAVDRARGDGRYWLVEALSALPLGEREGALSQVLDKKLRPDERHTALYHLARLRPSRYLPTLVDTGLRSRSINVQQTTVVNLPDLVGDGLPPVVGAQVEGWLRRRLANPRRESTRATWEIPGVALALLPSYGTEGVAALLTDLEPRMHPDERETWRSLKRTVNDAQAFQQGLGDWLHVDGTDSEPERSVDPEPDLPDPTAEVSVDRVMKRLGYTPVNPDSPVHDSLADYEVHEIVIDVSDDEAVVDED